MAYLKFSIERNNIMNSFLDFLNTQYPDVTIDKPIISKGKESTMFEKDTSGKFYLERTFTLK